VKTGVTFGTWAVRWRPVVIGLGPKAGGLPGVANTKVDPMGDFLQKKAF